MAASLDGVFPADLSEKINNCKVLIVGSGGIGCEILKCLVLTGFPDIVIVDMDTIDVSNLNRQFLFHREHVGKSKAQVAVESALKFNPNAKIKAHHDSITSTNFGVNFYKQFNVVLNALDNRAARNHVNRMCLNADVPLIESGTAGYNGQVELIKKGLTQCYECTPKATQKTFPGCTIRNTPSEPIHCIVWAKHLFNQLFGETADEEDISPDMADPEAAANKEGEEAADNKNGDTKLVGDSPAVGDTKAVEETKSAGDGNVERVSTRQWAKDCNFNAEALFDKFFYDDINYLLSMSNLWKTRKPPAPVRWQKIVNNEDVPVEGKYERQYHQTWSLKECAIVFASCVKQLSVRYAELNDKDAALVWDKDDQPAMDFVAACANIRAHVFGIATKSRFEIKSMAGNIIPAIATTNAITAGIVALRALKVLLGQLDKCTSIYVRLRQNPRQQIMVPEKYITPPNAKCIVCAADPAIHLRVDTNRLKIAELRDEVLIKTINMVQPEVTISSKGVVIISADAEETVDNEQKVLSDFNIVDGVLLHCDDFVQQYELTINIVHFDAAHDQALFEVIADAEQLKPKEEKAEEKEEAVDEDDGPSTSKKPRLVVDADDEDDDDLCLVEEESDVDEEVAQDMKPLAVVEPEAMAIDEGVDDIEEIKDDSDDSSVEAGSGMSSAREELLNDNNAAADIVDLDCYTTDSSSSDSSNDYPLPNLPMGGLKRKAPLVEEEITEILDSDEEEQKASNGEAAAAVHDGAVDKLDADDEDNNGNTGPTPCKRSRVEENKFSANEVINID